MLIGLGIGYGSAELICAVGRRPSPVVAVFSDHDNCAVEGSECDMSVRISSTDALGIPYSESW